MKLFSRLSVFLVVALCSSCSFFGSVPWEQFVNEVTPPVNRVLNAGMKQDLNAALLEFENPSEAKAKLSALLEARRDVFDTVVLLKDREDGRFASVTQGTNIAKIELRIEYGGAKTALFKFDAMNTMSGWKFKSLEIAP